MITLTASKINIVLFLPESAAWMLHETAVAKDISIWLWQKLCITTVVRSLYTWHYTQRLRTENKLICQKLMKFLYISVVLWGSPAPISGFIFNLWWQSTMTTSSLLLPPWCLLQGRRPRGAPTGPAEVRCAPWPSPSRPAGSSTRPARPPPPREPSACPTRAPPRPTATGSSTRTPTTDPSPNTPPPSPRLSWRRRSPTWVCWPTTPWSIPPRMEVCPPFLWIRLPLCR